MLTALLTSKNISESDRVQYARLLQRSIGVVGDAARVVLAEAPAQNISIRQKPRRTSRKPCKKCGSSVKRKKSVITQTLERVTALKNAAVDFFADGMHLASESQQHSRLAICSACPVFKDGWCDADKGGCGCNLSLKVKARSAYCPQGKWFAGTDNFQPIVNPTRHLAFHLYVKKNAEWNWHWHIDQIKKYTPVFNGKIVIGITYDPGIDPEQVQALFDGVPVAAWVVKPNGKLAETLTHVEMFEHLQTTDLNEIIFRYHTKGVTKKRNSVEQQWAEIMWTANMDLASVDEALAEYGTCGVLRSNKPLVPRKGGNFFFAGSAYWMRAKEVFERDWRHVDEGRWWVEYFPAHIFSRAESACIFHDETDSPVLSQAYFDSAVNPEYSTWKFARGIE